MSLLIVSVETWNSIERCSIVSFRRLSNKRIIFFCRSLDVIFEIPSEFASVAAGDTKIKFRLDRVVRKSTTVRSWKTNDAMKKTSTKGQDAYQPASYFNIWVVGEMGGVLGYATFPESAGLWNDGVVIAGKYFGNTSSAPYNLGRTATHEVGH